MTDQEKYWNGIIRQTDVASLLASAQASLDVATETALDAIKVKMSPHSEGAVDKPLIRKLGHLQRELNALRMSAGPVVIPQEERP